MDIQRWERICRESQVKPEKKINTDKGIIYIGERYSNGNNDFPTPHYMTLWAVAKGSMDVARPLYFEFAPGMPPKDDRIAKAADDAWTFLND